MTFRPGTSGHRAGQFRPGRSGNPGGRPKGVIEVIELARQHTAEAIETLVQVLKSGESDAARVSAANAILDRGWGKAPATLTLDDDREPSSMTDEELEAVIRNLGRKMALGDGVAPPARDAAATAADRLTAV